MIVVNRKTAVAMHTRRDPTSARARTGKVPSTLKTSATVGGGEVPAVPTELFIGGEWRDAADGETFDVVAPSTEEHLATVAAASAADVDDAVAAARAQFEGGAWSRLTGADRGLLLHRLADLIERDIEIFVTLEKGR